MAMEFVSEVDRKFFANNLLSNEDWDPNMDISDVISFDSDLSPENFIKDLPEELSLPLDTDDLSLFGSQTHDDLLNDWSDSSDSGVSSLITANDTAASPSSVVIKEEPLSPAYSTHSDTSDSNSQSLCLTLTDEVKQESPPFMSQHAVELGTQPQQVFSFPVKQDRATFVVGPNGSLTQQTAPVNIHSILNSKVKIQPKPEHETVKTSTASNTPAPTPTENPQSLVLTAEEFARLTSQGVLRFQPPKKESGTAPAVQQVLPGGQPLQTAPPCSSTVPAASLLGNSLCINGEDSKDVKLFKRQQRMIKNRESASLSRKKKKEYLSTLELQLHHCNTENMKLKNENSTLKRKVNELHCQNEALRKSISQGPSKKTCLLAVVLFFSLNLVPWSDLLFSSQTRNHGVFNVPVVHKGRQLMSISEDAKDKATLSDETLDKLHEFIMGYGTGGDDSSVPLATCPTYFNRTESMRLAEQLAGWMYRHEEEKQKILKKKARKIKEKNVRPINTLKAAMRGEINPTGRQMIGSPRYQLQVYGGEDTGQDFLKAIHRRNDTFYVFSFDTDYYLVPAIAHNKTMRPRMSLVMPAVALNESMSPPENRVGMMQIDCEVVNTQLIHVEKSAIPKHVRDRNTTFTKFEDKKDGSRYP